MGTLWLPKDAYYGAQTLRAARNFPISGLRMPSEFIRTLGLVKRLAAEVNEGLGLLSPALAGVIVTAAGEVTEGEHYDQFIVDVFQTGSGTSTNMNANEVIAGRANEILTGVRGGRRPVHPNDHVNLGQSSNDVIPTVLHVAARVNMEKRLIPALETLAAALEAKAAEFAHKKKIGRTHLMDAVPVTLGREFGGWARQVRLAVDRLRSVEPRLAELALGGTAVGSGLGAHPEFAARVIVRLSSETGLDFIEARDHFEAQGAQDAAVELAGALKTAAVSLYKIANDIRWLASGPRFGLAEIVLPELQPGSSIMPGKVNPVLCEVVIQVAAQVVGMDAAVTLGGLSGALELNTMLPSMAFNLLEAIRLMTSAATVFTEKCVAGIQVNDQSPMLDLERNLTLATHLVPVIGYDQAAAVAKEAHRSGKNVRETVAAMGLMTVEEADRLLAEDPNQ
jgi:fumarate hydratase class II